MPPKTVKIAPLKILQRWHFSSQLRRMGVIASYQQQSANGLIEAHHIGCVKGAPETIKSMVKESFFFELTELL